ncbi:hypothetical protein KDL44_00615 [bacterium]|nr:hypothetical protein [bacterium]
MANRLMQEALRASSRFMVAALAALSVSGCDNQAVGNGKELGTVQAGQTGATEKEDFGMMLESTDLAVSDETVGSREFTELSEVTLRINNGVVTINQDESLAPGTVRINWEIRRNGRKVRGKRSGLEIYFNREDSELSVEDERIGNGTRVPDLHLKVFMSPGISVETSLGNGEIKASADFIDGLDLGNGNISFHGSLRKGADIHLGNGMLTGDLLGVSGRHSIYVGNGNVDIDVADGVNCSLNGSVAIGSIDLHGKLRGNVARQGYIGATATAMIGEEAGNLLSVDIGNGELQIGSN